MPLIKPLKLLQPTAGVPLSTTWHYLAPPKQTKGVWQLLIVLSCVSGCSVGTQLPVARAWVRSVLIGLCLGGFRAPPVVAVASVAGHCYH